jgi:hypothetical protein
MRHVSNLVLLTLIGLSVWFWYRWYVSWSATSLANQAVPLLERGAYDEVPPPRPLSPKAARGSSRHFWGSARKRRGRFVTPRVGNEEGYYP